VSFAQKIVVTHCAQAVYTVHGPRPCTRHVHGRLHGPTRPVRGRVHGPFKSVYNAVYTRIRVHRRYKAVYAPYTRPCTGPIHSRIHGPCTRPVYGSVNVRVHGPCTRPRTRPVVYMAGRPMRPCTRSQTARYGRLRPLRPCTRPVHSPFTAVYTAVYDGPYTAVRHVHTSTPQLKGRVRAMYTSVYTASTQSCTWQVGLHSRVHGPRRHVTAVGRVHGRNVPCTRSCTRPIYSRVHVRLHGQCTRPRTRTVCRNGPHTAVACRLGTGTWPGRPTCRIHGPDGPCTRPCNSRVHGHYTAVYALCRRPKTAVYTASVHGRKRPCTRPVHCRVHEPIRPVHSRIHDTLHGRVRPSTAVYGRVD